MSIYFRDVEAEVDHAAPMTGLTLTETRLIIVARAMGDARADYSDSVRLKGLLVELAYEIGEAS